MPIERDVLQSELEFLQRNLLMAIRVVDGTGNAVGYAVCRIPDWVMQERIDVIEAALRSEVQNAQ